MYPILQNGDIVEYETMSFASLHTHDIVVFYDKKKHLITHRIIYKKENRVVTRGDNNPTSDGVVQKGQILARAVRFKRKGQWHSIEEIYLTQSALYLHEIQQLELALNKNQIPHVFLKGVLISLRYEGTIPKRIYADCDILVKRSDHQKITTVFRNLGYTLSGETMLKNKQSNKPEESYYKMVQGIPVVFDIHFEPVFLMTQLGGMGFLYPQNKLKQLGEKIISKAITKKI